MVTGFPPAVRLLIRQRSDGWCERCGKARGVHAHHRRPRGMGSSKRPDTNTASNCLWLCLECHNWAEINRTQALLEGVLVLQIDCPAKAAVRYRGVSVFLDDNGNLEPAVG